MAQPGDSFNIPHYVKAGSPEGLRLAMLKNNMTRNIEFQYYQIVFDGKSWFAWYYDKAKESILIAKK